MGIFELFSGVIKFVLIGIVYLFILRVVKMVYLDISDTKRARRQITGDTAYLKYSGKKKDLDFKIYDTYAVGDDTGVGKNKKSDICLPTSVIAPNHARIFYADGNFYVEDLGSKNGTFVNGKELTKHPARIKNGDKIAFANIKFVFVDEDIE